MTDTPPQLTTNTCDKCGQTDDHPRHVQYVAFNHPVTGEPTDLSVSKHLDCCAEDGCPICGADMEGGAAGLKGDALREFLLNRPDELKRLQFERNAIETPEYNVPTTSEEEPA